MKKVLKNKKLIITTILIFTIGVISNNSVIFSSQAKEDNSYIIKPEELPPIDFTWTYGSDCRTIMFTSSCDDCADYSWDFTNDGIIDAWDKTVFHTYPAKGIYTIEHCVNRSSDCITKQLGVGYPIPDFEWMATGLKVTFNDLSNDCDSEITYRGWDFTNDGSFDDYGEEVVSRYPYSGSYNVRLVIQDDEGYSSNITKLVTVTQSIADLDSSGNLNWANIEPNTILVDSVLISNIGDSNSELDWEIESYPNWGTWEFKPISGDDLTPAESPVNVEVKVTIPSEQNAEFTGEVKIINEEDSSDYEIIPVSLTTSKNKSINVNVIWLFENHPHLFPILKQLLNL